MSSNCVYILNRVPLPEGPANTSEVDDETAFGEDSRWGFTIPWVYQTLAKPKAGLPMLQAPRRGDEFWAGAHAYWGSLLHLLIYGFGWTRPDCGLRWWYDAGKPSNDPKLSLLRQVWDADGQLDWFAAWLWVGNNRSYIRDATGGPNERRVAVDSAWLRRVERSIEDSGVDAPYGGSGGSDPLHLTMHIDGPMRRPHHLVGLGDAAVPELFGGTLHLDSMTGWYGVLLENRFTDLFDVTQENEKVEVVVDRVGSLGTFHRSPTTGLWYSGRHSVHLAGN